MIEIPLNSNPEQLFSITIQDAVYDCRVMFNSRANVWTISFAQNGEDIVTGISLLGGVDQMKQYNIAIKNMYVVNLENRILDAHYDDLGEAVKLFILEHSEVPSG